MLHRCRCATVALRLDDALLDIRRFQACRPRRFDGLPALVERHQLLPRGHDLLDDLAELLEGVLAVAAVALGKFHEQLIDSSANAASTATVS